LFRCLSTDLKGLVLAAGEGSRLRPFTFSRPKHLIPLLGKPMIQYVIDDLVNSGVRDVGVVVGYFGDLIRDVLGDGSRFGSRLDLYHPGEEVWNSSCNTFSYRVWLYR